MFKILVFTQNANKCHFAKQITIFKILQNECAVVDVGKMTIVSSAQIVYQQSVILVYYFVFITFNIDMSWQYIFPKLDTRMKTVNYKEKCAHSRILKTKE